MTRISFVPWLQVESISASAILIVGDAQRLTPDSKALVFQKEISNYLGTEGDFNEYPIFSKEIPEPTALTPVQMNIVNESKFIKVRGIEIKGVDTSSIIQIGSNCLIESESRFKQIRQVLRK
ncbi:spore germination protein GerPE [Paenibacillus terrigena]|uniref:spore germination protein GerPE n=1 Tax=Paenibacillus terrigena TaxID=369333 RepID=UPI000363EF9E|nr:spore germination protein GerPE [Paenibacillus terrigena]